MSQHDRTQARETYNGGKDPIDEIFVSITLDVKKAGYLEHGSSQGDHRPIWIDLDKHLALGTVLLKRYYKVLLVVRMILRSVHSQVSAN